MDERAIWFNMPSDITVDLVGVKSVPIRTTGHKKKQYHCFVTGNEIEIEKILQSESLIMNTQGPKNGFIIKRLHINQLTVHCPNGANAPRYRGCLSAISYCIEVIKIMKSMECVFVKQ